MGQCKLSFGNSCNTAILSLGNGQWAVILGHYDVMIAMHTTSDALQESEFDWLPVNSLAKVAQRAHEQRLNRADLRLSSSTLGQRWRGRPWECLTSISNRTTYW